MFLFLKLILAHLIADFIFQFEELYRLKIRSFLGQLSHVMIHGLVMLAILFPYLNLPQIWFFVAGLTLAHLAQDLVKHSATRKIPANTFLYFMLDQFCHVLMLSTVLLLPISREIRGFPSSPFWDTLYRTNFWTLSGIFFITLTFAGSYVLNAFAQSYLKDRAPLFLINSQEMAYAILERSLLAWILLAWTSPWELLLLPCVGVLRLPFKSLRDRTAFLLSLGYAVLITFFFQKVLLP